MAPVGCRSSVTTKEGHRHSLAGQGRAQAGPAFAGEFRAVGGWMRPLLLRTLGEGGVHFSFLDTGRGVSALTKILLFGAIAHHAGMLCGGMFLGALVGILGIRLAGHFGISRREGA